MESGFLSWPRQGIGKGFAVVAKPRKAGLAKGPVLKYRIGRTRSGSWWVEIGRRYGKDPSRVVPRKISDFSGQFVPTHRSCIGDVVQPRVVIIDKPTDRLGEVACERRTAALIVDEPERAFAVEES